MKKKTDQNPTDELRPEYDFASMKGGVRGKYVKRYRAEAFPTQGAVNEAVRGILDTTRAVRRTGGLQNKALQPTTRRVRRRKGRRAKTASG